MDSWFAWLWAAVLPLAKRVITGLGFGWITYEGVSTAINSAIANIQTAFGGLIAEVAALLAISGFFDAMAITSGGIVSGLVWMVLKRWAWVGTGTPAPTP
jgi:hypothetical protein